MVNLVDLLRVALVITVDVIQAYAANVGSENY